MANTNRNRGSPRLLFTAEERSDPALARAVAKAEKAGDKAESAQKKLKMQRRLMLTAADEAADAKAAAANPVKPDTPQSPIGDMPESEPLPDNRFARVKAYRQ